MPCACNIATLDSRELSFEITFVAFFCLPNLINGVTTKKRKQGTNLFEVDNFFTIRKHQLELSHVRWFLKTYNLILFVSKYCKFRPLMNRVWTRLGPDKRDPICYFLILDELPRSDPFTSGLDRPEGLSKTCTLQRGAASRTAAFKWKNKGGERETGV